MLNIGLIGNTEVLEPHVKLIQRNKNVNVIGKASVGTSAQLNSFHFSIPEFNRIEVVERADILLVDNSSLLPFDLLCNILKKGKHIFATEYLKLSIEECTQLIKLSNESGSVVQVTNPNFYMSGVQWLNRNFSTPMFLDISKFSGKIDISNTLYPLFLMLIEISGLNPKKVAVSSFHSDDNSSNFTNIRLDFGDASTVNLNFGSQLSRELFILKGYSKNQFVSMNFLEDIYESQNINIEFEKDLLVSELDVFINSVQTKTHNNGNLEHYLSAIQLLQTISKKIKQFVV